VLVIVNPVGVEIDAGGREALGVAAGFSEKAGGGFDVAVVGPDCDAAALEAAERGARRVLVADAPALASPGDVHLATVAEAVRTAGAGMVIVSRSANVLSLAPRLAARLGGSCVGGVIEIRSRDEVVASVFGGSAHAVYGLSGDGPRVISLAPGAGEAPERQVGRSAETIALALPAVGERIRVVQPAEAASGPRLEDARVVVSGGRGIGDAENYALVRQLAAALGGMPGASRAIVDDGWAGPAEQVGLTGKIVTPDLYVALGISGASQHMAGCSNSRVLVAVNRDPEAPIFRYAQLGIVDDCLAVLPELIRLVREAGQGG
jgi:electron transfer flavoprotein alpha subunit